MIKLIQTIKCFLGFHNLGWYSKHDANLFHLNHQDTGPLVECRCCDFHGRIENGKCGPVNAHRVTGWINQ